MASIFFLQAKGHVILILGEKQRRPKAAGSRPGGEAGEPGHRGGRAAVFLLPILPVNPASQATLQRDRVPPASRWPVSGGR